MVQIRCRSIGTSTQVIAEVPVQVGFHAPLAFPVAAIRQSQPLGEVSAAGSVFHGGGVFASVEVTDSIRVVQRCPRVDEPILLRVQCCAEVEVGRSIPVTVYVYRHRHTSASGFIIFCTVGSAVACCCVLQVQS